MGARDKLMNQSERFLGAGEVIESAAKCLPRGALWTPMRTGS